MDAITVLKLNPKGQETWRYTGLVLNWFDNAVLLEARFNRPDLPFHGIVFGHNDRFVEIFYSDRWYNLFQIHDREDGRLKGWYCNIGRPAVIQDGQVSYVDLALDLLVYPDGHQLVLDEEDYLKLQLTPDERSQTDIAMRHLRQLFSTPSYCIEQ